MALYTTHKSELTLVSSREKKTHWQKWCVRFVCHSMHWHAISIHIPSFVYWLYFAEALAWKFYQSLLKPFHVWGSFCGRTKCLPKIFNKKNSRRKFLRDTIRCHLFNQINKFDGGYMPRHNDNNNNINCIIPISSSVCARFNFPHSVFQLFLFHHSQSHSVCARGGWGSNGSKKRLHKHGKREKLATLARAPLNLCLYLKLCSTIYPSNSSAAAALCRSVQLLFCWKRHEKGAQKNLLIFVLRTCAFSLIYANIFITWFLCHLLNCLSGCVLICCERVSACWCRNATFLIVAAEQPLMKMNANKQIV